MLHFYLIEKEANFMTKGQFSVNTALALMLWCC